MPDVIDNVKVGERIKALLKSHCKCQHEIDPPQRHEIDPPMRLTIP